MQLACVYHCHARLPPRCSLSSYACPGALLRQTRFDALKVAMQMSSAYLPPGFEDTLGPDGDCAVHVALHPSPAGRAVPRVRHSAHGPVADHSGSVSLAWLMYSLLDSESPLPLYIDQGDSLLRGPSVDAVPV